MVGGKTAALLFLLAVVLGLSGCVTKENYNAQVLRTNNFQRLLAEEEKRGVELSTEIAKLKDEKAGLEAKNKALAAQLSDAKGQVVRSLEEVGRLQDEVKQARGGFSSAPAFRGPSQEPPDRLGELMPAPAVPSEKKSDKKKGKAEVKAKAQKSSQAPSPKADAPAPPPPPAPMRQESSQEPPDRLGELQAAPVVKSSEKKVEKKVEKPVVRKTGKATATVRVRKQSEEPSSPPPLAEAPPPPAKAGAKAKAEPKVEPKAQAKTETESATEDSFFLYHKVKKGETLASIAKLYKTDAQTLRELNDLASGASVRPGDRLIVGQKQ